MNCPRCLKPLQSTGYEGIAIDSCPVCQGHFLDKGEILQINKARTAVFSDQERAGVEGAKRAVITEIKRTDKTIKCPKCQVEMNTLNYAYSSGIMVDLCPQCESLWLDKGELEQIQIIVEEWEQKDPQIRGEFVPTLKKIKDGITAIDRIREARLPQSNLIQPLLKAVIYKVI
jgi:Zn-finger nucleic acid-binding protein